jgi:hypothetical protein
LVGHVFPLLLSTGGAGGERRRRWTVWAEFRAGHQPPGDSVIIEPGGWEYYRRPESRSTPSGKLSETSGDVNAVMTALEQG